MDISYRPLLPEEELYTVSQSSQLGCQTGEIDTAEYQIFLDKSVVAVEKTIRPFQGSLRQTDYQQALDAVAHRLLNAIDISEFSRLTRNSGYGMRADAGPYAFICSYLTDENLVCIVSYTKLHLDKHIAEAKRGIRFIDANYNDKFRVEDGDAVIFTYSDGTKEVKHARYIDSTHLELGDNSYGTTRTNIYHICELAESLERCQSKVEPLPKAVLKKMLPVEIKVVCDYPDVARMGSFQMTIDVPEGRDVEEYIETALEEVIDEDVLRSCVWSIVKKGGDAQ